jgi:hypothetical protein
MILKTRVTGFYFSCEEKKGSQHMQRNVARNCGFERESLAELCPDKAVGDAPLMLGHSTEVT